MVLNYDGRFLEGLQHLQFCCTGFHLCRVRVLVGWPWGLVHKAESPTTFVPPALLAVRPYLAWCFRLPSQGLVLSVAGLQHQLFSLLEHVRLEACYFPHHFAEAVLKVRS